MCGRFVDPNMRSEGLDTSCRPSIRSIHRKSGCCLRPCGPRRSFRSQTNQPLGWGGDPSPVKSSFHRMR